MAEGKSVAQEKIDRFQQQKSGRMNFETYWQTLHDYFYVESPNVNTQYYPGTELNFNRLWDSTTLETGDVLASGFMNYLTPPTSMWFKLMAGNPALRQVKSVRDYLEDVGAECKHTLNKSNFYNQMIVSYKSSGVYGTSCMLEEEDVEEEARFMCLPIKQVCIVDDARGRVAEYYIEFEYTAFQAATRWGAEKLSTEMQQELTSGAGGRGDTKHLFLLFIGKRHYRDDRKSNKENMPIQALWIDVTAKITIEENGYNEFPAFTHRFDKRPYIPWGFSPAMKALPMARLLNAAAKTNIRTMMKGTDPPIAAPNNAFIMPWNGNPRAVNYYKKTVLDGSKSIFPFGNFGDPNIGMMAIEYYSDKVRSLMYNDVFLAFENIKKQMNNPEVLERINEKMTLLGPSVGRFTGEVLDPIVIRTIGILFRRGKLPPMPDELIEDGGVYEIDYVSQLAQSQKRSQLNALSNALTMTAQISEYAPTILDGINPDEVRNEIWDITGAVVKVLRGDDEIQAIRENRSQAAAKEQEMLMLKEGAGIVKTGSEVDKNVAQARAAGEKK